MDVVLKPSQGTIIIIEHQILFIFITHGGTIDILYQSLVFEGCDSDVSFEGSDSDVSVSTYHMALLMPNNTSTITHLIFGYF